MVEYDENGKPIPDGRIIVEIARELAEFWDGSDEPRQNQIFWFKDIDARVENPNGLLIRFPRDRGERANTMQFIPWHSILAWEVRMNSSEYVDAARAWEAEHGSSRSR